VSFGAALADVLSLYEHPYAADDPPVCLDEKRVTLQGDVVDSLPVQPGYPERVDDEYERIGTANRFVMVERRLGYRQVEVTERRSAVDDAHQLPWLADGRYPQAKKIRLVQDHLNPHCLANRYLVFPPQEARRLAERFEGHDTPTHASWLNRAESEIGIFERGCLRRRVPSLDVLRQRVAALETERNTAQATINWRFTTGDARIRLARLYPKLESNEQSISNI
jgi:hypothetical protein